jgi:hypothetical protein
MKNNEKYVEVAAGDEELLIESSQQLNQRSKML